MKFESRQQKQAIFEGKGIETVRRDQCKLTQSVLQELLTILFTSGLDEAKKYLMRQWQLILSGKKPVTQFILTGRVRSQYRGGKVGPVQAVLSRRLSEADPGRVIRHKERLAYVIVATPGVSFRLKDCVLTPMELLEQWDKYTVHTSYYITKHLNAAVQRCIGLVPHKIDVSKWFDACPKPPQRIHHWPLSKSGSSVMISSFFGSDTCIICKMKCSIQGSLKVSICHQCLEDGMKTTAYIYDRLYSVQVRSAEAASTCRSCNLCLESSSTFARLQSTANRTVETPLANCTCIDCPNTFIRHRLREAELEAETACRALDLIGAKL